nr:hypothetical protein [Rhodococcus aetherivorans]
MAVQKVVALLLPGLPQWFNEFHIDLQLVAGTLLLVALPPHLGTLVALRSRQPAGVELVQDAPDAGRADREVVVSVQIHGDLLRSEVVLLSQPEDLLDDLRVGLRRLMMRDARAVLEPVEAFLVEPAAPLVVALPADAVVAAGRGDVTAHFLDMTQYRQLVLGAPLELSW